MPYFKVRDLMIHVTDERLKTKAGIGKAGLCLQEQPTQLECGRASPIMQVIKFIPEIERASAFAQGVIEAGAVEAAAAVREVAEDVGLRIVASAGGGGGTAIPDPECGGTSGIPTPLTPVIHKGSILTAADLPGIKQRIREALVAVEAIEKELAPRGGLETEVSYDHLRSAAESLKAR